MIGSIVLGEGRAGEAENEGGDGEAVGRCSPSFT